MTQVDHAHPDGGPPLRDHQVRGAEVPVDQAVVHQVKQRLGGLANDGLLLLLAKMRLVLPKRDSLTVCQKKEGVIQTKNMRNYAQVQPCAIRDSMAGPATNRAPNATSSLAHTPWPHRDSLVRVMPRSGNRLHAWRVQTSYHSQGRLGLNTLNVACGKHPGAKLHSLRTFLIAHSEAMVLNMA